MALLATTILVVWTILKKEKNQDKKSRRGDKKVEYLDLKPHKVHPVDGYFLLLLFSNKDVVSHTVNLKKVR